MSIFGGVVDMNEAFVPTFFNSFFIALGVLLGGSIIGGLSAFLTGNPPLTEIYRLSNSLRIWAIVAAIGGTFDTVYNFERGLMQGETDYLIKQIFLILSAFGGAQTGSIIITWLTREHLLWEFRPFINPPLGRNSFLGLFAGRLVLGSFFYSCSAICKKSRLKRFANRRKKLWI